MGGDDFAFGDDPKKNLRKTPKSVEVDGENVEQVAAPSPPASPQEVRARTSEQVLQHGASARLKMFEMCNMFEEAAAQMLVYALGNPIDQQAVLAKRQEMLQALYKLRFLSDVDDDFSQLEFEAEMRKIKTFRIKMQRLQEKEDVDRDTDDTESSDDTAGEDEHIDIMKEARKNLSYTFGQQVDAIAANAKAKGTIDDFRGQQEESVLTRDKTWRVS